MLIRFEASNFRSIDEAVELSMVAVDRDRPEAREQPTIDQALLPVAAIFGPNASGKSNVIGAFIWLRDAIVSSLVDWEDGIPIEPFAFGDGPSRATSFFVDYMIDDVRFEYILELDANEVIYEGLFHYPEKRSRRIFERERLEFRFQRGLGKLSATRELLTRRSLALSVARRYNDKLVNRFARALLDVQVLGQTPSSLHTRRYFSRRAWATHRTTADIFEGPQQPSLFEVDPEASDHGYLTADSDRDQALGLLKLADLGIDDVTVDREELKVFTGKGSNETISRQSVQLIHKTREGHAPLPLSAESDGTRTWFRLIGPVIGALRSGSLLLFDELDASLHPTLSAQVIKLFHSPVTNPKNAQLIFSSHDTSLLNHLNRDEVWLTTKRPSGSTRLGALAEFAGERVRRSQNLESAYLHGRFGALPQVDQADFLRAIGLIG